MYSSRAVGFRVLVKPDPIEETTEGGIILAVDKKLEEGAQVTGIVIDVGPEAYRAFNKAAGFEQYRPWVRPGDHIFYARYAGKRVIDEATKEELLFLNDEDVAGLVNVVS
jgi:co-chaperonin GroES (HSP10)